MLDVPASSADEAAGLLNEVAALWLEMELPAPGEPLEIGPQMSVQVRPWREGAAGLPDGTPGGLENLNRVRHLFLFSVGWPAVDRVDVVKFRRSGQHELLAVTHISRSDRVPVADRQSDLFGILLLEHHDRDCRLVGIVHAELNEPFFDPQPLGQQ